MTADDFTPAEALGINIAARLPDDGSDPGWVQPEARIDDDTAIVIAAADHTQTFENLLSTKDRDAFINWLDDHED